MPFQVIEFVGVHSATRGASFCRWASESWMGCLHRGFPGHCLNSPRWLPDRGSGNCPGDGPWTWSSCFMLLRMENMKRYGTNPSKPRMSHDVQWCALHMIQPESNQHGFLMFLEIVLSGCHIFPQVFKFGFSYTGRTHVVSAGGRHGLCRYRLCRTAAVLKGHTEPMLSMVSQGHLHTRKKKGLGPIV